MDVMCVGGVSGDQRIGYTKRSVGLLFPIHCTTLT